MVKLSDKLVLNGKNPFIGKAVGGGMIFWAIKDLINTVEVEPHLKLAFSLVVVSMYLDNFQEEVLDIYS